MKKMYSQITGKEINTKESMIAFVKTFNIELIPKKVNTHPVEHEDNQTTLLTRDINLKGLVYPIIIRFKIDENGNFICLSPEFKLSTKQFNFSEQEFNDFFHKSIKSSLDGVPFIINNFTVTYHIENEKDMIKLEELYNKSPQNYPGILAQNNEITDNLKLQVQLFIDNSNLKNLAKMIELSGDCESNAKIQEMMEDCFSHSFNRIITLDNYLFSPLTIYMPQLTQIGLKENIKCYRAILEYMSSLDELKKAFFYSNVIEFKQTVYRDTERQKNSQLFNQAIFG